MTATMKCPPMGNFLGITLIKVLSVAKIISIDKVFNFNIWLDHALTDSHPH